MFPIQRSVLSYFLEPQQIVEELAPINKRKEEPAADPIMDIFCDGSCSENGRARARAGFGLLVKLNGTRYTEVSEALDRSEIQTNQRAELRGLERALEFAVESHLRVRIFTDSMYSINCITKWAPQWKDRNWFKTGQKEEIQHKDIIIHAYELWQSVKHRTTIEHVRAHTGNSDWKSIGNQRADELASASLR